MQTELAILTQDDIINAIPDPDPDSTYETSPPPPADGGRVEEMQQRTKRTVFTRRQLVQLEQRFMRQTFLSKEERADLAEELKLTERQIMVWFQNRRGRLKRRGPADSAYSQEKLNEVNQRRPYPFLYGLLSSMHYRYPQPHPYQNSTMTATTTTDTINDGPCFTGRPTWCRSDGVVGSGVSGAAHMQHANGFAPVNFMSVNQLPKDYQFPSFTAKPNQFQRQFAQFGRLPTTVHNIVPNTMGTQIGTPGSDRNLSSNTARLPHPSHKRKFVSSPEFPSSKVRRHENTFDDHELPTDLRLTPEPTVPSLENFSENVQRTCHVISPRSSPDSSIINSDLGPVRWEKRDGLERRFETISPPNTDVAHLSSAVHFENSPNSRIYLPDSDEARSPENKQVARISGATEEMNNNISKHCTTDSPERELSPCAGPKAFTIKWEQPDDKHAITIDWLNYQHLAMARDGAPTWPFLDIPDINSQVNSNRATSVI